tara:strand:- start:7528 stop:7989 length:462 start_codon:yes stop_codon:yes gene_type:complete
MMGHQKRENTLKMGKKLSFKNWPKAIIMVAMIGAVSTSCKKEEDDNSSTATVESFTDLKVTSTFDWSSARTIQLNVSGVEGVSAKDMLVITTADGTIVKKAYVALADNAFLDFKVPGYEEELTISWGTLEKTIVLGTSNIVEFTFLEPDTNEE